MLFEFDMPEKIYNAIQDDVNIATMPFEDLAVLQNHLYKGKILTEKNGALINRSDALDAFGHGTTYNSKEIQDILNALPPVKTKEKEDKPVVIYTILTCTKLEEWIYPTGLIEKKSGFPDYGTSSVVGFYTSFSDAHEALMNNRTDLWETCYDYACIEKVEEGLANPGELVGWYKFDREKGGYFPIKTPDFEKHICGRTIG